MLTPLPVTYQYTFAMVKELEAEFEEKLDDITREYFLDLKEHYADPVICHDGFILWQCNMINDVLIGAAMDVSMAKLLPRGSWGSVTLPYFVTRESALKYKFIGALKYFPFRHQIVYCLNVENYADDPTSPPDVSPDGEYASIGLSVSRKGAAIIAERLPKGLKAALEPFCCFHEKFNKGEFKDDEAWLYGNVPWNTTAMELEEFVKANLKPNMVTFIKIPQKKPLEHTPVDFFEPGFSNERYPVFYGTYGPFHLQKDHFLLSMFQQLNFSAGYK